MAALTREESALPGQRTWAEVPFGNVWRAETLSPETRAGLPWDPAAPVHIDGTQIRIGGYIDRLDLAVDRRQARVTDYKSGRAPGKPPQIDGRRGIAAVPL